VTPEPSGARRAVAGLVLPVALFAAVVLQLTVVNRVPLPGGGAPDLVLLLVTAVAVAAGPLAGALSGFAGGLALDVAPPVMHYAGEYALVFCLAGYGAARVVGAVWASSGERDPVFSFGVMAAATGAGEAGKAVLGLLLSDPDVTGHTISRVLPGSVLYDLLLAPLACWLVAWVARPAAAERGPALGFSRGQRLASAFRQASAGAAPDLRLAGSGRNYRRPSALHDLPRLRLAGTRSPASRTAAGGTRGAPLPLAGGRTRKLGFGGDLTASTAARRPSLPGRNWLRPSGSAGSSRAGAARRRAPRRGWLAGAGPVTSRRRRARLAAPQRGWPRSGRHPWQRRRQRLLRLVGVGR
jgi:rod shape-determining protein MreD